MPHGRVLVIAAILTAVVLVVTAESQLYDSNFYYLAGAASLIAGDHPYRDFYEWGVPLALYLSAAMQVLVGYRIIGEFVLHWFFIVAGMAVSFHLGLCLSRSTAACLATFALALVVIADTPVYHSSKIFFFPVGVWLAWRYMDKPGMSSGALFGFTTAVAFLFRHDYGVYLGFASIAAFGLARIRVPASRRRAWLLRDAAAYAAAVAVVVTPWAVVVHRNEGLLEYTRMRAAMYEEPEDGAVYSALLKLNPVRQLTPPPTPLPTPGVVAFFWSPDLDMAQRQQFERQYGLRLLADRDSRDRLRYEVSNLYDPVFFELDPYIRDGSGFEWDRLDELRWRLPTHENTSLWLAQMALLVPVLLLLMAAWDLLRSRGHADDARLRGVCRMLLAGSLLVVVDSALFRQPSYATTVAPVTAALSARFLVARTALARGCAIVIVLLTGFAAAVWARDSLLFRPSEVAPAVSSAFRQLVASPPVDGTSSVVLHYLHDCTAPGDRLLVAGSTPYQVNYYAQRPFAGQLFWRDGWRADPFHQRQVLDLLERQSIPFAFSTHEPVLDEVGRHPMIRQYLTTHYVEVQGFQRRLLVDRRRQPTGTFGAEALPCFR